MSALNAVQQQPLYQFHCDATIMAHRGSVNAVKFSTANQCQYCLTAGSDKLVKLFNPWKSLTIKEYQGHGYDVMDVEMYVSWILGVCVCVCSCVHGGEFF